MRRKTKLKCNKLRQFFLNWNSFDFRNDGTDFSNNAKRIYNKWIWLLNLPYMCKCTSHMKNDQYMNKFLHVFWLSHRNLTRKCAENPNVELFDGGRVRLNIHFVYAWICNWFWCLCAQFCAWFVFFIPLARLIKASLSANKQKKMEGIPHKG